MRRFFRRLSLLTLLALLGAFTPPALTALATAPTVTNSNDSGSGSLRQAIADANATAPGGPVLISFDILSSDPGFNAAGYWTIKPTTPLPALTRGSITIDGTTQPNGRTTGPKIVLDGSLTLDPLNGNQRNSHGIVITSAGNTVKGLVINNFVQAIGLSENAGGAGVYIAGPNATGNFVLGCYIGTTPDGATAAKNSHWGVLIDDGATGNQVGGLTPGDGNLISGNGHANVAISQTTPNSTRTISGNQVLGNLIGTTAAGTAAIGGGNPGHGVVLGERAQNNTVGGTAPEARNVIAGHSASSNFLTYAGVNVASQSTNSNNVISGNYIGTSADGSAAIPNAIGVQVRGASGTLIGGTTSGARNIISGNNNPGVLVEFNISANTTIAGNWIGLNAAGQPLGNHQEGVLLDNSATTTTVGPGNVISANGSVSNPDGVRITNPSTQGNAIVGNFIGTDTNGLTTSTSLLNLRYGVRIDDSAHNNRIGGTAAADRNVIAARDGEAGLAIIGAASANLVQGNFVGVNALGTAALDTSASSSRGILISGGATGNTVGGAATGARNIISANAIGVEIAGAGTSANNVVGNSIGVDTNGQPLGNRQYGVLLDNGSTGNTIGGSNAGEGNLIANNAVYGIFVSGAGTNDSFVTGNTLTGNGFGGVDVSGATGIQISQTQTHANNGAGIKLSSGGNNSIAAPASLQVSGTTLSGTACANCVIEVFTSAAREDGEGPRYLTRVTASGGGSFSADASGCDAFLTATARDASGNTSAFSPMVGTCVTPQAGVQLSPGQPSSSAGTPKVVAPGGQVVYSHMLTNSGSLAGTFTIARTTSQGWASQPNITSVTLNPNESRTILITVTIPLNAPAGTVDQTTVTASTGGISQSQSDYTQAGQTYGVNIEPDHSGQLSPTSVQPVSIDYTHTITNTGNGSDTIRLSATHTAASVSVSFPDGDTCLLAAQTFCTRTVRVTVAPGSLDASDVTTVTATASNSASDSAHDTTTITQAAIPQITPDRATRAIQPISTTVVFTHTITNIGARTGTFTATVQTDAPPSWSFVLSGTASFQLAPSASTTMTLTVTVPDRAEGGPHNFTLTVASSDTSASAIDTVDVASIPGLLLAPDRTGAADPGQTITYTHTLTNTGNSTDSFTMTLETSPGWSAAITPTIAAAVPPGGTRAISVSVTAPSGVAFDSTGTVTVTATSALAPYPQASVEDVTTINPKIAAELLPSSQSLTVTAVISGPGVITFTQTLTHTLHNSGSISGTFALTATTGPLAWTTIVTPSQAGLLAPGETTTITVSVTIPAGTPLETTNVVTTEVRELSQPQTVLASAQDTLLIKMLCFLPWMFTNAFAEPSTRSAPTPPLRASG